MHDDGVAGFQITPLFLFAWNNFLQICEYHPTINTVQILDA